MSRSTDARLLWQTGDSMGNYDLGDNVITLKSSSIAFDSLVTDAQQTANSQKTGSVISIDGQFDDWIDISKNQDLDGHSVENPNADQEEYAVVDEGIDIFFYLRV